MVPEALSGPECGMRFLLFFIIIFSLPHSMWIPGKLGVLAEEIPLGVMNLIFIAAAFLYLLGAVSGPVRSNSIKSYTCFLLVVILSISMAFVTGYEDPMVTISLSKQIVLTLMLYYLPLVFIKDEREFFIVVAISLFIHVMIGFEVLQSGVLGGPQFHDGKRGSGPFGWSWTGSDIAGSYLAQVVMFFVAFIIQEGIRTSIKTLSFVCVAIVIAGILSTYGRGAILACVAGGVAILVVKGLKIRYVLIVILFASLALMFLPESVKTRFSESVDESTGELDSSTQGRLF
jgi:hypothetical protein